jgi:hypothetical protein
MQVRRSKEGMDAIGLGRLDRAPGSVNVFAFATGQGCNAGSSYLAGDGLHGLKVAFRGNRETSLKDVYAEIAKLMRHPQLLVEMHGAARTLFAIAKGGIEEDDLIGILHNSGHFRSCTLS